MNRRTTPKDPHVPSNEGIYLEAMDTPKLNRVGGGGGACSHVADEQDKKMRVIPPTSSSSTRNKTAPLSASTSFKVDSKVSSSRPVRRQHHSHDDDDNKPLPSSSKRREQDEHNKKRHSARRSSSSSSKRHVRAASSSTESESSPSSDHRRNRRGSRKHSRDANPKRHHRTTKDDHHRQANKKSKADPTPSIAATAEGTHHHRRHHQHRATGDVVNHHQPPPAPFMPFGVPPPGMDPPIYQSMLFNMPAPTYSQTNPPYPPPTSTNTAPRSGRASLSQPVSRSQSQAKSQGSALERLANVDAESAPSNVNNLMMMHPSTQYWNHHQHQQQGVPSYPWQWQQLLNSGHPLPFVPPPPTGHPPPPTMPLPGAFAPIEAARWSSSSSSSHTTSSYSSSRSSSGSWSSSSSLSTPPRRKSHKHRRGTHHDKEMREEPRSRRNSHLQPASRTPRDRHQRSAASSKLHSTRSSRACTPRATQTEDVPMADSRPQSRVSSMPNSRASSCSRQQEHRLRRVAQKAASHGSDAFGPSYSSGYFEAGTDARRRSSSENEGGINVIVEDITPPTSTTTPPSSPPVAIPFMQYQHSQFMDPTALDVRRRAELYKWSGGQDEVDDHNNHQYSTATAHHHQQYIARSMQDTVSSSMRFGKSSYARFKHERDNIRHDDDIMDEEVRGGAKKGGGRRPTSSGISSRPHTNNNNSRVLGERGAVTRSDLKGTPPPLSQALRRSFVSTPNTTTTASRPTTPHGGSGSAARRRIKSRPPWIAPNTPSGATTPKSPRSPRTRSGYNLKGDHHHQTGATTVGLSTPTSPNPSPMRRGGRSDLQKRVKKSEERADQQASDMESLYRKLRHNYEKYHDDPNKFLASFEETHRDMKQVGGSNANSKDVSFVKSAQSSATTLSPTQYASAQKHFPQHHHTTILQPTETSTTPITESNRLRTELSELEQQWSNMRGIPSSSTAKGGGNNNKAKTSSGTANGSNTYGSSGTLTKPSSTRIMKGLHEPDDYEVHPSSSPPRVSSPTYRHRHVDDATTTAIHTPRTATRLQNLSTQEGVLALIRDRRNQQQQSAAASSYHQYPSSSSHRDGSPSHHLSSSGVAPQHHPYGSLSPLAIAPISTGVGSYY